MNKTVLFPILLMIPAMMEARVQPTEPHYQLAYQEAQLEGIRELPEEEMFLYLSYGELINREYYAMVHHMIVTKHSIQQRLAEGVPDSDPRIQESRAELEQYMENLRKESERILGYAEVELELGREALEELESSRYTGFLRWDYYQLIRNRKLIQWLKELPEEEMFQYLSDRAPVNYGFRNLVDDLIVAKTRLEGLDKDSPEDLQSYRRLEASLEQTRNGLRVEAGNIMKALELDVLNGERAIEIAKERLNKKEPSIAVK